MKNVVHICCILVFTLSCMVAFSPACAEEPKGKTPALKLFKEKAAGYTTEYPADWVYEVSGTSTFVFSGPSGTRAFYSTVSIQNLLSVKAGGSYRDVDSVVSDLVRQFQTAGGFKMSGITPFRYSKGGVQLTGKEFVAEYTKSGTKFKQWVIVLPRPGERIFHTWFYTSPMEQYDEFLGTAKAMLNSWTIIE